MSRSTNVTALRARAADKRAELARLEAGEPPLMAGDSQRVQQVVWNLLRE